MRLKVIKGGRGIRKYKPLKEGKSVTFCDKNQQSVLAQLQSLIDIADNIEDIAIIYTTKEPFQMNAKYNDSLGIWSKLGMLQIALQVATDDARGK